MATTGFFTILDHNGERSTTRFYLPDITVLNWAGVTQDLDEIADAVADGGMIRGEVVEVGYSQSWPRSNAAVTDQEAQREKKWIVHYTDICQYLLNNGTDVIVNPGYMKKFTVEIATALLDGHMVAGQNKEDLADMAHADVVALVAALEANMHSPYNYTVLGGVDPVIRVDKIVYAGRNT